MASIYADFLEQKKAFTKEKVQLPQDWFGRPTWPQFYCKNALYSCACKVQNRSYICINRQLFLIPKEKPKSTILWLNCLILLFSVSRLLVRERTPSFIILSKDSSFRTVYLQRYQVERWRHWLATVKYPLRLRVLFAPPLLLYMTELTQEDGRGQKTANLVWQGWQ